jgi:hypothetical protein
MAYQEGIELSRLHDYRHSNEARAGASILPGSQTSTTGQASGPTGPGSVRRPPSRNTGSNHDTQSAIDIASSSNDNSPLIPEGEDDVQITTGKQRPSVPWTLRRASLLGLIAYLLVLIAALEIVHSLSDKNQGLITAEQSTSYLWKYLPTAGRPYRHRCPVEGLVAFRFPNMC